MKYCVTYVKIKEKWLLMSILHDNPSLSSVMNSKII